ncbi:tartrate dehydrogenase-like protein [Pontimonas salivibrio]|uniref:D-malate dehydrogenase (decarboxylating) n=1 Tax=Pontimonas salivibrio TaxID=1159327 RepID=A0A2L2BRE3_9MICO|nr:tartrate dehydrogenase [Pontimonas salivibrio]AVG24229.1 tartrate dehydrogenase-like protein [Pontimonas salivibrio]
MTTHKIATLPGDGIGNEVVPVAMDVVNRLGEMHGFTMEWEIQDWGCERYVREGSMMPSDALDQIASSDAIFLGAVGAPGVPDHVSLWGMLIPIRRRFDQYVNLRPAKILRGIPSPLKDDRAQNFDMVVIRENVEGEYSAIGGRLYSGSDNELAIQENVFTRRGVTRVMAYAFELAQKRGNHLTSATKSNGIIHTMPFWDEIFDEMSARHADVTVDQYHIDALVAMFVLDPSRFDVVVASNLFGDILTDLSAAMAGSIGIAPSANINPERIHPSMFEPVHGSAPDIAGKGIANPIGQVWSAVLMLEHLGHPVAAKHLMHSMEEVIASEVRTPDIGGTATTHEVAEALMAQIDADLSQFTSQGRG